MRETPDSLIRPGRKASIASTIGFPLITLSSDWRGLRTLLVVPAPIWLYRLTQTRSRREGTEARWEIATNRHEGPHLGYDGSPHDSCAGIDGRLGRLWCPRFGGGLVT